MGCGTRAVFNRDVFFIYCEFGGLHPLFEKGVLLRGKVATANFEWPVDVLVVLDIAFARKLPDRSGFVSNFRAASFADYPSRRWRQKNIVNATDTTRSNYVPSVVCYFGRRSSIIKEAWPKMFMLFSKPSLTSLLFAEARLCAIRSEALSGMSVIDARSVAAIWAETLIA